MFLLVRRRFGYAAAGIGAALPLPWLFLTESPLFGNSWIAMNASDGSGISYLRYFQLRIVCVAFLLVTVIWALTRLLPASWSVRRRPINQWTWPALVTTFGVVFYWFATSVFPYRQPVLVNAMRPELSILHVEKDGITFHETSLNIYRDGLYLLRRNDRRLFSYSFGEMYEEGILTNELSAKLKRIKTLPAPQRTLSKAPRSLRVQHGEGWYTEMNSFAIASFTTENSAAPPPELVAFFHEIKAIPVTGAGMRYRVRDVCLGFCYDPKAGLGYRAANQRCSQNLSGKEFCY
jgi:hypothetical protein